MVLKNLRCVYCDHLFVAEKPTSEHVIARNFVPPGSFEANDWNLIVNACNRCNNLKSALENELSALTLQPAIGDVHEDATLADIAQRKAAKVRSQASGKLVKDSAVEGKIEGHISESASVSFGFVGPAQLSSDSVMRLAAAHISAFFFLTTYNETSRTGVFLPRITWWYFARRTDWGNELMTSFADATRAWLPRVQGCAAKGNFRIALKRMDSSTELWSFALEWNRTLRIIGTFGDEVESQRFEESLAFGQMKGSPGERYREEIPLQRSEDDLFECVPA
jgi:hypothetical protein